MAKSIKSMTLEQAQSYQQELKSQGKTESTSKEYGKLVDYIKTLTPEKYGAETVQSAYEKLSSGVTTRDGWTEANLSELNSRGIYPNLDPVGSVGDAGDLTSMLSSYQDGIYGAAGSPELRESIISQLEPDMAKPEPLNRVEEYEKMRNEMGVADLETSLTDLKAQLEEQYAQKRARTNDAKSKPVSMGVIGGRISEIEQQEMDRIDALGRQINVISDQLNTSYNVISTYMNFMGLDYQDAVSAYNTEFNRNLQIYQIVDAEMDEQTAAARSNLQMYANAITSGNMSYGSLSSDQKSVINKLEVQSGLPIGFISKLNMSAKDSILATSSDGTEAWVLDANGNMSVIKTGLTKTSSTGTAAERAAAELKTKDADMKSKLSSISGGDGNISPDDWLKWMQKYRSDTGASVEDFVLKFSDYINMADNPARYYGYEQYYLGKKQ